MTVHLTLFRIGRGKKHPPPFPSLSATSVSPVTSLKEKTRPPNFLTFSFEPFTRLLQSFKAIPSISPKLSWTRPSISPKLSWTRTIPKRLDFLVKFLQSWSYDNFYHRNTKVTKLWHMTKSTREFELSSNLADDLMDRTYDVTTFI